MSLKGDRYIVTTDIGFHLNETGEKGQICVYSTSGSGAALDQGEALVTIAAVASGNTPAGLLLTDVVNYDLTRRHLNFQKDEMQQGGKVPLMTKGWVVTNRITAGTSPTAGNKAYLNATGDVTPTVSATGGTVATPLVGYFKSSKDEDGYAKLSVDLPV